MLAWCVAPARTLSTTTRRTTSTADETPPLNFLEHASGTYKWKDLTSEEYKRALLEKLEEHRKERYTHLSDTRWQKLKRLISMNSDALVIDDVAPTVVEGFAFDIELIPEAKPVRQPLGKLSPQQMAKEAYHLEKEERLGHLRTPTDEQKSEHVHAHYEYLE